MLPLHDKVRVVYKVDTGQKDPRGNPIYTTVDVTLPAEVRPLGSSDDLHDLTGLARYRVILDRHQPIPPAGWASLTVFWGAFDGVRLSGLTVDGTVDAVTMRGRIHHYELTTKAVVV